VVEDTTRSTRQRGLTGEFSGAFWVLQLALWTIQPWISNGSLGGRRELDGSRRSNTL